MENLIPKISVVIPVYNRADLLALSIMSVERQTYRNIELIVVDDFSVAEEAKRIALCVENCDVKNKKLIRLKVKRNGAYARNLAVRIASGKYIAFLDSDDTWEPEKLARQVDLAEREGAEPTIFYCSGWRALYTADAKRKKNLGGFSASSLENNQSLGQYLFCENRKIITPSIFARRDLLRRIRFNSSLPRHQDYDLLLRCEAQGVKFKFLDKNLVFWNSFLSDSARTTVDFRYFYSWYDDYSKYLSAKARSGYLGRVVLSSTILKSSFYESTRLAIRRVGLPGYISALRYMFLEMIDRVLFKIKIKNRSWTNVDPRDFDN
jgi:glycosyltransferase involved in cell wall biosynthesis